MSLFHEGVKPFLISAFPTQIEWDIGLDSLFDISCSFIHISFTGFVVQYRGLLLGGLDEKGYLKDL